MELPEEHDGLRPMTKEALRCDDVKQTFDKHAVSYEEDLKESLGAWSQCAEKNFFDAHKARCVQRLVPDAEKCLRILDFGCGTGGVMAELAAKFPSASITGFDVSLGIAAVARERLAGIDNVRWVTEPEIEAPFDMVIVANVLHHVPPPERVDFFQRVRRCLATEGIVVVFEHNPYNLLTLKVVRDCSFDRDAELLSASLLSKCAADAGLLKKKLRYVLYLPWAGLVPDVVEFLLGWFPFGAQYAAVFKQEHLEDVH